MLGENPAKIVNFAGYLRNVFYADTDPTTLEVAAATLGHLVQTGGALTADVVEFEVRNIDVLEYWAECVNPKQVQHADLASTVSSHNLCAQ